MAGEDTKPYFVPKMGNGIFCIHTEFGENAINNDGKELFPLSLFPKGENNIVVRSSASFFAANTNTTIFLQCWIAARATERNIC